MGQDILREARDGRDTRRVVRDGSGHPLGGLGRVGPPYESSGTPSGRSGTGRDTLREVRDGLGHPSGCPRRVGTPTGKTGTPCGRFGTGQDILREV